MRDISQCLRRTHTCLLARRTVFTVLCLYVCMKYRFTPAFVAFTLTRRALNLAARCHLTLNVSEEENSRFLCMPRTKSCVFAATWCEREQLCVFVYDDGEWETNDRRVSRKARFSLRLQFCDLAARSSTSQLHSQHSVRHRRVFCSVLSCRCCRHHRLVVVRSPNHTKKPLALHTLPPKHH